MRDRSAPPPSAAARVEILGAFLCSFLDNSFISLAVYYWRGRYIKPLDVNCFCQASVLNNPQKIYGGICLPFINLKFS